MFIRAELTAHHRFSKWPDNERDEIVQIILERSRGMYVLELQAITSIAKLHNRFQMACCLIDVVDHIRSRNAIATLETDLPEGLNEMYKRLLENID